MQAGDDVCFTSVRTLCLLPPARCDSGIALKILFYWETRGSTINTAQAVLHLHYVCRMASTFDLSFIPEKKNIGMLFAILPSQDALSISTSTSVTFCVLPHRAVGLDMQVSISHDNHELIAFTSE